MASSATPSAARRTAISAAPAVRAQAIARAAHGLDRLDAERPVDLLAQVADVDVDDVRAVLVLAIPRVLEQLEAVEDLAGAAHERVEQGELLGRQLDLGLPAPDPPRRGVEPEVARLEHGGAPERAPARERAQPRGQLLEGERLGEVVVGARVEPAHAVLDRVAGGEHERGRAQTSNPSSPGSITSSTIAS